MRPALAALLAASLLAGCAVTPAGRIERDPATFAALTPAQQAKVREGMAAVGFTPEAVTLALGKPDRIINRESAEGETEVWLYYVAAPGATAPIWHCNPAMPWFAAGCVPLAPTLLEERARVTFKDGQVISVERARR
jgi:hypothetical protein